MKPVCFDCCSICILDYSVIRLSGERRKETDMVYTIIAIAVGLLETAITILFCRKKNLLFGKAVNSGVAEESESKSDSQPEDDPNENTHQAKSLDDNTEIAEEKTTDEGIDNVSVDSSDYSGLRQSVIIETEAESKIDSQAELTVAVYNKTQSIALSFVSLAIFLSSSIFLIYNTGNIFGYIKLTTVMLTVVIAAITDLKQRIIPNIVVLFGLAVRVIIYVFEILFDNENVLAIFKNDLIGFAVGFGVLFLAYIISRKSIGMGDVKLFAVIGISTGGICTYTTLLFSLIINTVVSVTLIIIKKKKKKDSVPFAPSILIGYLVSIFIASF